MEYDPSEVPELIEPIARGAADVVFGSRLRGGKPQRAYMFWHLVGNKFLSLLTNVLYNTTLSDMETGYKAFRVEVLRSLELRQNDFAIEPAISDRADRTRRRRRRLRLAPARRQAAARVHVLAPRRQQVPLAAHERPVQHDALRHGDGLQGVPRRGAALARAAAERLRDRAGDH